MNVEALECCKCWHGVGTWMMRLHSAEWTQYLAAFHFSQWLKHHGLQGVHGVAATCELIHCCGADSILYFSWPTGHKTCKVWKQCNTDNTRRTSQKEKGLISISAIVGQSIAAAKALFDNLNAEKRWAKIIITITNYSIWRLNQPISDSVSMFLRAVDSKHDCMVLSSGVPSVAPSAVPSVVPSAVHRRFYGISLFTVHVDPKISSSYSRNYQLTSSTIDICLCDSWSDVQILDYTVPSDGNLKIT